MPIRLTNLQIRRIATVDHPDNEPARIVLFKRRQDVDKAVWTAAYENTLPDSAFAVVLAGGSKDSEGKTVPRNLRKLPYKDATGKVDMAHLRNALSRLPQANMPPAAQAKARRILQAAATAYGIQVSEKSTPTFTRKGASMPDFDLETLGVSDEQKATIQAHLDTLAPVIEAGTKAQEQVATLTEKVQKLEADLAKATEKPADPIAKASPEVKAAIEKIEKQAEADRKAREDLQKRLDERDESDRQRDAVAKVEKWTMAEKKDSKMADAVKTLRKADPKAMEVVEDLIDRQNAVIQDSALFKEIGRSGSGGSAETKLEKAATEIRKADPKLTPEQAYAQATEEHPEWVREAREEA